MKKLTKAFVSVFGTFTYLVYLDLRSKYLPSKKQKKIKQYSNEDLKNRIDFYSNFVRDGDLCFDIGANTGNRVTPLLKIGAKVVAVEPNKELVKYLKWRFGNRITIVPKGLGDKNEINTFYISDSHTLSSFSIDWINAVKQSRFKNIVWEKTDKIQMTTLENLIELYGLPKFIKIDVEGFEYEVLKGLKSSVNFISFEFTVPEQSKKAALCLEYLNTINSNIECNYCIGENMVFASADWLTLKQMKQLLFTDSFYAINNGDIYIRKSRSF